MTKAEKLQAIQDKLEILSIEDLKFGAKKLMTDYRDGADVVFELILNVLEKKMTEIEYREFCAMLNFI